ncbi:MAG TPA: hypothetical protein VFN56_01480 [Candidatus Saccharimonadales bacterium]|nr:hypothetical protein [Candidatus Saccharimonadales bacterium]
MADSYYTPGVCNINPKESAYRRRFGIGFGALGLIGLAVALAVHAPSWVGIALFLFYWISALSFLQAKNHFCVNYAASGKYNVSDEFGDIAQATAEQHKKDTLRARRMHIQAVLIGIGCALIATAALYIVK